MNAIGERGYEASLEPISLWWDEQRKSRGV
jgi:hypothetical protein